MAEGPFLLPQVIIEKNVGLIVVDSVAAIVRREFSHQSLVKRQGVLAKEAQILKQREAHEALIPTCTTF